MMYSFFAALALVTSAISIIVFYRKSKKSMLKMEELIEKNKEGHTMVGGVKMSPFLFYFGSLAYNPEWKTKDQEAAEIIRHFRQYFGLLVVSFLVFLISIFSILG